MEGQFEKALEIALVFQFFSVEYKLAQDDGNRLLADLRAMLPKELLETLIQKVDCKISADPTEADALAYALELARE